MDIETLKHANAVKEKIEKYEDLEYIFTHARDAIFQFKGRAFVLSPDDDELRDALLPVIKGLVDKYREEFKNL